MASRGTQAAAPPSHLVARLAAKGPKRILSLDGGGTRGIITLAFLAELERVLRERFVHEPRFRKKPLVLADYFDLIGGTSVGALIGTMLAMGLSVAEAQALFIEGAPTIFGRKRIMGRVPFGPMFSASPLRDFIDRIVGSGTKLGDPRFKTGLAIVAKRLDTGSVWTLTNVPSHPYYHARMRGNRLRRGNSEYLVSDVLRASTAAPRYFSPKAIGIFDASGLETIDEGVFVDGGASPHNNPALMLLMMATMTGFNFGGGAVEPREQRKGWSTGADQLKVVSVGTGSHVHTARANWTSGGDGFEALLGVMSDNHELVLTLLQWLSDNGPERSWQVNRVMGDLTGDTLGLDRGLAKPLLSFQRYDAPLEIDWLNRNIGRRFSPGRLDQLRDFTSPSELATLGQIGVAAARGQVKADHFPPAFDGLWTPTEP